MATEDLHDDLSQMSAPARRVYTAPAQLHNALQNMLGELLSQRLEVGLAPSAQKQIAQRGGKVRQVQSQNPEWYRRLAAQFTARRAVPRQRSIHDTLIKRREIVRVLQNLLAKGTTSSYAPAIISAAERYQQDQEREEEHYRQRDRERALSTEPNVVQQASDDDVDDVTPF